MNRRQFGEATARLLSLASVTALAACGADEVGGPSAASGGTASENTTAAQGASAPASTAAPAAAAQPTAAPLALADFDPSEIVTLLPRDAIPAIFDPEFMTIEEIQQRQSLQDEEPVLGFEHNGEAHAYSVLQLDRHEIVNDVVGGRAIAATW